VAVSKEAAMSDNVNKKLPELSLQVAEVQNRIFMKLVFDIWELLEKYNHYPPVSDPPTAVRHLQSRSSGNTVRKDPAAGKVRAPKLLTLAFTLVLLLKAHVSLGQAIHEQLALDQSSGDRSMSGQSIAEQKKAVVFIFGSIHPLNLDNTAMTDAGGNRVQVSVPLGTGFFVAYSDRRYGQGYSFSYLVTAKHILLDVTAPCCLA
jgi:hypothetical protein